MRGLHVEAPLVRSVPMASAFVSASAPAPAPAAARAEADPEVWLKMESAQPVGSFKIRGIGHACVASVGSGATRLVSSSGGNAGYAVAFAGRRLGVPVEVFVPATTPEFMREVIRGECAMVTEHGASWDDAHHHAVAHAQESGVAYIHPFDDPLVWEGHATLVHEVAEQGVCPDAVVVSVGGGGLMLGVLHGMHAVGWTEAPVVAVETAGADSFARSVAAGELVTLPSIDSVATSLGARTVAAAALEWTARHPIRPCVVTDRAAVEACVRFAGDHRVLVEPACGASLAAVYDGAPELAGVRRVLVVVCGGAAASLELLGEWRRRVGGSGLSPRI